jgi:uncharacterized protein with von Willebrand factor type A (vWA) domain
MHTVPDRVRDLFARTKKAPSLSASVVRHERIDEIVCGDLREHSPRFDAALDLTVEVEREDGSTTVAEQAPDLWTDLFYAHYTTGDTVRILDQHEVKPSNLLHQRIMQHFSTHEDFLSIRPHVQDDDLTSALSTMAAQATLDEEYRSALAEHAGRAQQMSEAEQRMAAHERQLEELRERVRNGDRSESTLDALRDLAAAKADARQELQGLIEEQDHAAIGMDAANAVDRAVSASAEIVDAFVSMPGTAQGERRSMSPEEAFDLAVRWKDNPQLRQVMKLVGRMERDFRFQRSSRVQGGREVIVDVELGNDLELILPTEAMKLMHPLTEALFFKGYMERSLTQYETVGDSPAGDGPIVVCRDCSGSMNGTKMVWASAVTLAMLSVAQRERRSFANIDFNRHVLDTQVFPKGRAIDPQAVTKVAATGASGGTDITTALIKATEIIGSQSEFRSADIVVITDGSDTWDEHDVALAKFCSERGVRAHAFVIGPAETHYTNQLTDLTGGTAASVTDLHNPSDATRHVVQALS